MPDGRQEPSTGRRAARAAAAIGAAGLLAFGAAAVADARPGGGHGGGGGGGGGGTTPVANEFSGQATVLKANVLGLGLTLSDTGPLPPTGGAQEASLLTLDTSVGDLLDVGVEVAHASTVAGGLHSRAHAHLAQVTARIGGIKLLGLWVGGVRLVAEVADARAKASCTSQGAVVDGRSSLLTLKVDTGLGLKLLKIKLDVNAEINLGTLNLGLLGILPVKIVTNEQVKSPGAITVTALRVKVGDNIVNLAVSTAHADIVCKGGGVPNPAGRDFLTGGGWFLKDGARVNVAIAGGIKNGAFWGHLNAIDRGSPRVHIKGTGVTGYVVTSATCRKISGNAEYNGAPVTYVADVCDNGEPGTQDTIKLVLSNGYKAEGNPIQGGNYQLHVT